MKFAVPKWKHASRAARAIADSSAVTKGGDDGGDDHSIGSSLSSRSDSEDSYLHPRAAFENGVVVKTIDDSVLMDQAAESLWHALDLIAEASNKRGSWVDARDLLDRTAAALDDAGLALRNSHPAKSVGSVDGGSTGGGSKKSKAKSVGSVDGSTGGWSKKSACSSKKSGRASFVSSAKSPTADLPPTEALIHSLADEVVDKRRRILGDILVHDADGIWAKSEYGDGDGISFGSTDDVLCRVPDEAKEDRALVVWASQTGTAKKFARSLHKALGGDGRCVIRSMKGMSVQDLAAYRRVYIVCSTFGIGRPPREGEVFYSLVQLGAMRCKEDAEDLSEGGEGAKKPLEGTSVAIAALGSSAFRDFATFGFGLAEELASLGASAALDVTTLDAKNGKSEQKKAFRTWKHTIVEMEKERLAGWTPTRKPSKKKVSSKAA